MTFKGSKFFLIGDLLFLLVFTSGCATISSSNPKPHVFLLPGSFDSVWQAAIETLEKEGIPVSSADRSSGQIESKTFPLYKKEYQRWAKEPLFAPPGFCMLQLEITQRTDLNATLGIRAHFWRKSNFYFFGIGHKDKSRGVFETLLAGRVNDRLVRKQTPKLISIVIGCSFRYDEALSHYVVFEAEPGGFGYEQGFRDGDSLIAIDGNEATPGNFFRLMLDVEKEKIKTFRLKRGRETVELPDLPKLGIAVVRDAKAKKFKISQVTPNSPAARADFRAGDFLIRENGTPLSGWREYYRALVSEEKDAAQVFVIERGGAVLTRTVSFGMPS
jgi:membrane-associated protease RseP (regulator of RpoE activity)